MRPAFFGDGTGGKVGGGEGHQALPGYHILSVVWHSKEVVCFCLCI